MGCRVCGKAVAAGTETHRLCATLEAELARTAAADDLAAWQAVLAMITRRQSGAAGDADPEPERSGLSRRSRASVDAHVKVWVMGPGVVHVVGGRDAVVPAGSSLLGTCELLSSAPSVAVLIGARGVPDGWLAGCERIPGLEAIPWRVSVRTPRGRRVAIVAAAHPDLPAESLWAGQSFARAAQLAEILRDLLGVPPLDSSGRTVEALILATHPDSRGGVLIPRSPGVPRPDGEIEPAAAWSRPVAPSDGPWAHTYDMRRAYLAAWSRVDVGLVGLHEVAGAPETLPRGGWWALRPQRGPRGSWGPLAPGEWATSCSVARAREVGRAPTISRGWSWDRTSRWLAPAGAILSRALDRVGGGSEEERYLKDLYRRFSGRCEMERSPASRWARPDIAWAIRAACRTQLHRLVSACSVIPLEVATDAVTFASHERDPGVAAEAIGLSTGRRTGSLEHSATIETASLTPRDPGRARRKVARRALGEEGGERMPVDIDAAELEDLLAIAELA